MKNIVIKIASDIILAEELVKIAQELEEFTGAQAHLYRKEIKNTVEDSRKKIFEKYNNK